MSFQKKYGEWALILGATEGIGKAAAQEMARRGMHVILVGRREEKLVDLANEIVGETGQKTLVVKQDLSEEEAAKILLERTRSLDIGLVIYVACLHKVGKYWENEYTDYEHMRGVNISTFSKLFYAFVRMFVKRDRGAFITIGSLSGYCSLPYCAEYAANKAYMMSLTESVAFEVSGTHVDVMLLTAGSTVTPTWLKNKPANSNQVKTAMLPEEVIKEGIEELGKTKSFLVGEQNRKSLLANMQKPRDEMIDMMGNLFLKAAETKER